ncbi:MAG TPA: hypothetical protein VKV96_16000 [Roseiarcus sp.]|nr:hypothetical protein [Roseiarcus sp.]
MDAQSVTERHLFLFGSIINWFARYERLIAQAMAELAGADYVSVALMTRGLSFEERRRALLSILRHRKVPMDQCDRVSEYLRIPHKLVTLQEEIVHSVWIVNRELNSVQPDWILNLPPTVQPWLAAINGGLVEDEAEKVGSTIDDLTEVVRSLSLNYCLRRLY